jgi:hypothetical protein
MTLPVLSGLDSKDSELRRGARGGPSAGLLVLRLEDLPLERLVRFADGWELPDYCGWWYTI